MRPFYSLMNLQVEELEPRVVPTTEVISLRAYAFVENLVNHTVHIHAVPIEVTMECNRSQHNGIVTLHGNEAVPFGGGSMNLTFDANYTSGGVLSAFTSVFHERFTSPLINGTVSDTMEGVTLNMNTTLIETLFIAANHHTLASSTTITVTTSS